MGNRIVALLAASVWMLHLNAAEPTGYYTSCEGKSGKNLLSALSSKIANHTNVGYDGLWDVYKDSDVRPDGTLWDMYSTKAWPSNFTKCGNYKAVGDCVNREHSLPKSWWGGSKSTQYSDAFHLYPTDGYVNNQRGNSPYGECANGKPVASNGNVKPLGRLGTSTFSGMNGTVFEPDDQYKGDFARSYFYMAAAYNSSISSWTSGEGEKVFAGNNYPVFTTGALQLLLKWHRQDPVSDKEIARNEAVYKHQKNRNPFIDHPELVEYVWGNKTDAAWTLNASADPEITLPAPNSTIDLGTTAINFRRTKTIDIKGVALTSAVSAGVSGSGFSVSPATISAADANKGTTLAVSYISSTAGNASGVLTLKSGNITAIYTLTATVVDGLPAGPARNVSETGFEATWSCINNATDTYTLDVMRLGQSVSGYPRGVTAGDESYFVTGLEPETAYTYTVSNGTLTSQPVEVTTPEPTPRIQFLFDGDLEFYTEPGVPSEVAEIIADIENIPGDVTLRVTDPFQFSTDKASWTTSIVLAPGEERFYMRLYGNNEGTYTTTLEASADNFYDDNTDVDGTIAVPVLTPTFIEDFEAGMASTYDDKDYQGSACKWRTDAYINNTDGAASGNITARMNNKRGGHLTMLEDKPNGMGTLTLAAKPWKDTDASKYPAVLSVSVSADKGSTWEKVGEITISSADAAEPKYRTYSLTINRRGTLRMKIEQNTSARTMIDDIALTDYTSSGIEEAMEAEYHSWDAFCRNGKLVLESRNDGTDEVEVYSIDGILRHAGSISLGETEITVAPGMYVVVVRDFTRIVVVK